MAVALLAFGLAGCPGRNPDDGGVDVPQMDRQSPDAVDVPGDNQGNDANDVQMTDASDVQMMMMDVRDVPGDVPGDVPTMMDVQDVPGDVPAMADPAPSTIRRIVECGTTCRRPLDAVLNSTGTTAYFTAFNTTTRAATVYSVPVAGGTITAVATGGGLDFPQSIAISDDDMTLFVADLSADRSATDVGSGAVFSIGVMSGTVTRLNTGTELIGPAGITVEGTDLIVSGRRRMGATLNEAVFRVPAAGGTAAVIAMGAVGFDPTDVALLGAGRYGVTGTGRGTATGSFASVTTTITQLDPGMVMAYPAGIAPSRDGNNVLVAAWPPGAATRLRWVRADGTMPMAPTSISTGLVSPTGIGRARSAPNYVVADESAAAGGAGAIFEVR